MAVEKTILASVEGRNQTRVKQTSIDKKNKTVHVDKYLENSIGEKRHGYLLELSGCLCLFSVREV